MDILSSLDEQQWSTTRHVSWNAKDYSDFSQSICHAPQLFISFLSKQKADHLSHMLHKTQ